MQLHVITQASFIVKFKKVNDAEGDSNRGFRVDEITAYLDNKKVGYIKVSYIPNKRFEKYYPSIFNYLFQINGKCWLPYKKGHVPYKELNNEELNNLYQHYVLDLSWSKHLEISGKTFSREVLITKLKKAEKELEKRYKNSYNMFKERLVDKPIVDFIRVDEEFQRMKIGVALYLEAAKWMQEKGLKLHSSTIQSDNAKHVWKYLQRHYNVAQDKFDRYILTVS